MGRDSKYRKGDDNRRGKYTGGSRFERKENDGRTSSERSFGNRNERFKKGGSGSDYKPSEGRGRYSGDNKSPSSGYGRDRKDDFGGRYASDNKYGQERRGKFGSGDRSYPRTSDEGRFRKPYGDGGTFNKSGYEKKGRPSGEERPFPRKYDERTSYGKPGFDKKERSSSSWGDNPADKKYGDRNRPDQRGEFSTVYKGRGKDQKPRYETVRKGEVDVRKTPKKFFKKKDFYNEPLNEKPDYDFREFEKKNQKNSDDDEMRLNKYIANAGVCSRREADALIEKGLIRVNDVVVKELGTKVFRRDKVQYQDRVLSPEKPVYILLNKPKDFITTTDDPLERKTVMRLVDSACKERIFPVGRLDRNTTGLLLFTNDGELADKLSTPGSKVKKIYQVTLDKAIGQNDVDMILNGVTLEDGLAKVDDLQVLSKDRTILGMEIHIGRNRIVRRIFAHLGYDVVALDRVIYAGLTKKDVPRGKFRFLSEKEAINLKYFK